MSVVSLRLSVVKIFTDASIPRLRGDFDNLGRGIRQTKSKVSLSTLLCELSGLYHSVISPVERTYTTPLTLGYAALCLTLIHAIRHRGDQSVSLNDTLPGND